MQVSASADVREADKNSSVAAARSRDLQLEAEEGDAPFIAEELDRQGLSAHCSRLRSCPYTYAILGLENHGAARQFCAEWEHSFGQSSLLVLLAASGRVVISHTLHSTAAGWIRSAVIIPGCIGSSS